MVAGTFPVEIPRFHASNVTPMIAGNHKGHLADACGLTGTFQRLRAFLNEGKTWRSKGMIRCEY